MKKHILKLLKHQKDYWKKRYAIRWTKFRDENTKFFHAAAIERYKINTITSLKTWKICVCDYSEKVTLLLEEYKQRMGCTTSPDMLYNLSQLVQSNSNLRRLSKPFTIEEINNIVKQMPADKAPDPDGFNGYFIKSCWETIKGDFYSLCFDFFNGTLDLQSINNSFITLIPKTNNPVSVNDFRPISLLNCVLKIITKLLTNRLQGKITSLIHTN